MNTETVRVTATHISLGVRRDSCACPIALALRDMHPEFAIDVYNSFAVVVQDPHTPGLTASLPLEAADFITAFDDENTVEPFEFELTWQDRDETALEIKVTP